jgi:hypothetical protein
MNETILSAIIRFLVMVNCDQKRKKDFRDPIIFLSLFIENSRDSQINIKLEIDLPVVIFFSSDSY